MSSSKSVTVCGKDHTVDEAKQILAGYAFGTNTETFDPPVSYPSVGDPPQIERPVFAYDSYDCVEPAPGPQLSDSDLLVGAGLNGRLDAGSVLSMLSIAPQVSDALLRIPLHQTFWDLPGDDLRAVPGSDATAFWVWRAWWLLIGAPDVGIALTHKTLHHKRPTVFPLLDRQTNALFEGRNPWAEIHSDLNATPERWAALERWFTEEAIARDRRPITRLRIHDVLLWCRATGNLDLALQYGEPIVG